MRRDMSLVRCFMCDGIIDSDEHPDGFYVKGHEDKYICENCVETHNLEYDVA